MIHLKCSVIFALVENASVVSGRATLKAALDVRLLKFNADEEPRIASELGVASIPTLLLFRNSNIVARAAGAMDSRRIVSWARTNLSRAA